MTKLINPAFDYAIVDKDEAAKLRYYEREVLKSRKRMAGEVIKHGEILHGAQELLADYRAGVFVAWLASIGISHGSAYNAISAFVEFGSFPNLENLEVSAMYALAKNEKAKKKALKLADRGVKVTHSMAQELIQAAAPKDNGRPPGPTTPPPNTDSADPFDDGAEYEDEEESEPIPTPPAKPERTPEEQLALMKKQAADSAAALMRLFDDINELKRGEDHPAAIGACKRLIQLAKGWK